MNGSAEPSVAPTPPLILRVLSGLGAVVVFVIGLVFSLGAIIAAPLGIWLVQRWRRRRDRQPSGIAALFGAIAASSVLAVLMWSLIFALVPRPTDKELESAVAQNQSQPAVKLPSWYTKAFPQAARADSATQKVVQSPGFMRMALVLGAVVLALFFGVVGGGTGWGAYMLARIARAGQRHEHPPSPLSPHPGEGSPPA